MVKLDMERKNGKKRVLLVEPSPAFRMVLTFLIEDNFDVVEAINAVQALQVIKTYQIDVVISHLGKHSSHGLSLLRQIKKDFKDLPVVILTANIFMDRKVLESEGASACLSKVEELDILLPTLLKLVKIKGNSI